MQDPIIAGCRLFHHLLLLLAIVNVAKGQENLGGLIRSALEVLVGTNENQHTSKIWMTEADALAGWLQEGGGGELPPLPATVTKAAIMLLRARARSESPDILGVLVQFTKEITDGSSE